MEVNKATPPAWLNNAHPNYERWKRAREISEERGKFVESVLSKVITLTGLHILDLGSGEGGTSKILSEKNEVVITIDFIPKYVDFVIKFSNCLNIFKWFFFEAWLCTVSYFFR